MTQKKIRAVGVGLLVALWLVLTAFSWFGERTEYSDTERRLLAQAPELKTETLNSGTFMKDFEKFTLDQFPLREPFRQIKAVFHFYGLQQADKDGLYIQDGFLADMETELNTEAVKHAADVFGQVYKMALEKNTQNIYFSVIPDKNHYLAQDSGRLTLDLEAMEEILQTNMPWATYIDIKPTLTKDSYYHTDTHWRQEAIVPTAAALCTAMGAKAPTADQFTVKELDRPFYGVYYGQVAMPVAPDPLRILQNDMLNACKVTDYSGMMPATTGFHDLEGLAEMKDPYNVFLYGFDYTCTVIQNPNAATDKELMVFRDSYGCSITPLLVENYARVTVIDLRSFPLPSVVMQNKRLWNLENADVLFLFSSLVINNPASFRVG